MAVMVAVAKDFFGQELELGDEVAFLYSGSSGSWLERGVVVAFTPKMVRLQSSKHADTFLRTHRAVVMCPLDMRTPVD